MILTTFLFGTQHTREVWKTSRQARLLCPWTTTLIGCLHLHVADRRQGQAVYPSWCPVELKTRRKGCFSKEKYLVHTRRRTAAHRNLCSDSIYSCIVRGFPQNNNVKLKRATATTRNTLFKLLTVDYDGMASVLCNQH